MAAAMAAGTMGLMVLQGQMMGMGAQGMQGVQGMQGGQGMSQGGGGQANGLSTGNLMQNGMQALFLLKSIHSSISVYLANLLDFFIFIILSYLLC